MKNRRRFDQEFKRMAIELSNSHPNIRELARELGVRADLIYRWRREASQNPQGCFPGNGKLALSDKDKEIARLKKELLDAQTERDILKKAVNIFSRSDGKYTGL